MTERPTTKLRALMDRLEALRAEHGRQRNCPSRGYDEDGALEEMSAISQVIEAEMDAIDVRNPG
jgi:hypothetical protein